MSQIKTTEEFQDLFDIDANLNRLVKNIELLNYINPQNIAAEKKKFFSYKFCIVSPLYLESSIVSQMCSFFCTVFTFYYSDSFNC